MKYEVAMKWVEALRSGQYQQGKDHLKEIDGDNQARYCCLGVLCEISGLDSWETGCKNIEYYMNQDDFLPRPVKEWAGMQSSGGDLMSDSRRLSLIYLNDSRGYTFIHIADFIEENWKDL